jgi:O-glycosyl hydrolase
MAFRTIIATLMTAVSISAHPSSAAIGAAGLTLTIDTAQRYQTIDGFGFSEAFQRAYNIYNLAEPKRSQLVDLLFNTSTGAGFSILRNGIGSSPSSSQDWMNTILPTGPGSPSGTPAYVWDGKDSGQLWVAQQGVGFQPGQQAELLK